MVKDFSWNIIPWNALLFEKTLKQLSILDIENNGFILNTCHDTAKRAETRVGFPVIFSRLRWPIEPKFSQVCYFIYKLWYTKCGPLDNTVYRVALTVNHYELSKLWCSDQQIVGSSPGLEPGFYSKFYSAQVDNIKSWNQRLFSESPQLIHGVTANLSI